MYPTNTKTRCLPVASHVWFICLLHIQSLRLDLLITMHLFRGCFPVSNILYLLRIFPNSVVWVAPHFCHCNGVPGTCIIIARLGGALAGHVDFYAHSQWSHVNVDAVIDWLTGLGLFWVPLACGMVAVEGRDFSIPNNMFCACIRCWDSQPLLTNKQVMWRGG